jgi:hypothetical protein
VGDVQQLVDDVLNEGVFDVTSAQALRWLTRRHRKMVARSRCWRYETSLGGTVAAQGEYALPAGLVEIDEVTVGGDAYGKSNHVDAGRVAAGRMFVLGDGGLFSGGEDNQGAGTVTLLPVPVDSGVPIVLRGAFLPPDLQTADDSTLKVPGDFTDALVSGAIATGCRGRRTGRTSRSTTSRCSRMRATSCVARSTAATAGRVRRPSGSRV